MSEMGIVCSLLLMAFAGIGVDLIGNELKRTKLQNTLDRAVLAAADLEQILDPTLVVNDYMDKMDLGDALASVSVQTGLNYKTVSGDAHVVSSANFMKALGVENLQANATAAAEEKIAKVEISMVLDISGSMADNNKLRNMRNASNTFIDTVLGEKTQDLISISLVPYSEHVNAGPLITNEMRVNWRHGYSHCLEFPNSEFSSTALDLDMTYEQMQHFQWNYFGNNDRDDTVCPRFAYERITPFSQDASALKAQVAQLQPRAGTSIFLGMKWGTALLDPSTRGIATALQGSGNMDGAFAGRPAEFDDVETLKTVVLMTDGQHDRSFRIQDWAYNSASEVSHWDRYNLWYYLVREVSSRNRGYFYQQKYNAQTGDALLDDICDAAKANGIVIWSIGFEVTDHGASVMANCASSPSHFFRVQGSEIQDAFYSIARAINQLRLTQ
ncbi:Tad domain-containing protein [Thalassococcus sp. BH17M4-6]|uniref:Tad domain-containing protein n=1 Tax=Thalassococcus sp. BH17M4-6 TaxID=3413148 RepID=UPI003BED210B